MNSGADQNSEFTGRLVRDAAGFVLQADDGRHYRLDLLRTPIDQVEKRVVVTGKLAANLTDHMVIEAHGVRLA